MIPPFTPFELKAESAVKHRVKITFKDGRTPYVGHCISFSRALDCDPEIAEIDVQKDLKDRWYKSFNETEVEDIIILD